jgi:hypothetical protein
MPHRHLRALVLLLGLCPAAAAHAQVAPGRPAPAVELTGGFAGFVDDTPIGHAVMGAAVRIPLTTRVSIGPEVAFMRGPGSDRNLFVTGNLTVDLLWADGERPRRVAPFLVVGGGFFRHSELLGSTPFSCMEGAVTAGGGVRVWISSRVYTTAEVRVGWEPHTRFTGTVGIALPGAARR